MSALKYLILIDVKMVNVVLLSGMPGRSTSSGGDQFTTLILGNAEKTVSAREYKFLLTRMLTRQFSFI